MIGNTLIGWSIKWSFIGTFILSLWQFLQNLVLARILFPADFGNMALIYVALHLFIILQEFGFQEAIIQKNKISQNELSKIFTLNILMAIVFAIAFISLAPLISIFFKQVDLVRYFRISSIVLIINAIGLTSLAVLKRNFQFKEITLTETFAYILGTLIAIILAMNKMGFLSILIGYIITQTIRTAVFIFLGRKYFSIRLCIKVWSLVSFSGITIYLTAEKIVNYLSSSADNMIIGRYFGNEILGNYSHAWNIMMIPLTRINGTINQVALPFYSQLKENSTELSKFFQTKFLLVLLCSIPIYLFLVLCAHDLILLFYGPKWSQSIAMLEMLAILGLIKAFNNPAGILLLALGRTKILFLWNMGWLVFLLAILLYYAVVENNILMMLNSMIWLSIISIPIWYYIVYRNSGVNILKRGLNIFYIILSGVISFSICNFIFNDFSTLYLNIIIKGGSFLLMYAGIIFISSRALVKELYYFLFVK